MTRAKIACALCGTLHDPEQIEPRYRWPELISTVAREDFEQQVLFDQDWCCVRDREDTWRRYFLRALLPFAVRGRDQECCWGVWTEVSAEDYREIGGLWRDDGASGRSYACRLAIRAPGYPDTLDLDGTLRLQGAEQLPRLQLATGSGHPLADEQQRGVDVQRVLAWLHELDRSD